MAAVAVRDRLHTLEELVSGPEVRVALVRGGKRDIQSRVVDIIVQHQGSPRLGTSIGRSIRSPHSFHEPT